MKPKLEVLDREDVLKIHWGSIRVLEKVGVKVEHDEALKTLSNAGAEVDFRQKIARIPEYLVKEALSKAPSTITLYGRNGRALRLEGSNVYFSPGSAAFYYIDWRTNEFRRPKSSDLSELAMLVDALENIHAQSTALVVSDVPEEICDRYRLYIILKNSTKPVDTGAFTVEGIHDMRRMLSAIAGGGESLSRKPMATFAICPSPPLKWSKLIVQNLIDCAKYKLPVHIIPMPQFGATGPATLAGALVQHNAEFLSGLVLAQLISPGTPVIYGGSPSVFDMKHATSALGAPEVPLFACAYTQIAKFYGLPSQAYLALSDSKIIDEQAALETAMGAVMAVLAGVNLVSGPGMLMSEDCQSLVKLVVDDEICGMALRIGRGIQIDLDTLAEEVIKEVGPGGNFLKHKHTRDWFRKEQYLPKILDRRTRVAWIEKGSKDTVNRAREVIEKILKEHRPEPLPQDIEKALDEVVIDVMKRYGLRELPLGPKQSS